MAFAAGGAADTPARMLAERMRVSLGQPVIIENVTGASGSIGTGRVARAAGDGYTLVLGNLATHVINGAMLALRYDVVNDFAPVSLLSTNTPVIVAKKTMPANNLNELVAWLKANPDKATFGTGGAGSTVASFRRPLSKGNRHALRVRALSRRSTRPAGPDCGPDRHDDAQATNTLPLVRAGSIKAYAVAAGRVWQAAPEIPTVDEAGMPGILRSDLVCAFCTQEDPGGHHRQAQCRGGRYARRSGRARRGSPISAT